MLINDTLQNALITSNERKIVTQFKVDEKVSSITLSLHIEIPSQNVLD